MRPRRIRIKRFLKVFLYTCLFWGVAELTARIDDCMRFGTPILEAAGTVDSLKLSEISSTGVEFKRGKPLGRFRTWVLNEHGFRSPPFEKNNLTGRPRVMILGASESFGFAESAGKSFAERLTNKYGERFQVVNASMVGLPLWSMHSYWDFWLKDFHPDTVFLIASPLFYLGNNTPPTKLNGADRLDKHDKTDISLPSHQNVWHPRDLVSLVLESRIVDRLRNRLDIPEPIVMCRQHMYIEKMIRENSPDWPIRSLPLDRVELYRDHLLTMIDKIESSGVRVVLVTLPVSAQGSTRPEDQKYWLSDNEKRPRPVSEVKWQFLSAIRELTVDVGKQRNLTVVDLWKDMTGKREFFFDLNHFSDSGSEIIARNIAEYLDNFSGGKTDVP
jgi:hypothetical protein